jgi:hypothetical protein
MISEVTPDLGFAADHDAPIPYLQRTREYYQALGYGAPYEWAHYADVPFRRLQRALSACRVAIVTTAAPYQPGRGDQGPGAPYNAKRSSMRSSPTPRTATRTCASRIVAIDRQHTTAEDPTSYFPLAMLRRAAAAGRIGSVAARFHGVPTNRSQRTTLADRRPGDRRALPGRRGRRGAAGAELSGLSPDHEPGRAPARAEWNQHRRDGLREGHRRVGRRAAPAVLRLSAR